jgi:hypothetical protein
MSIRLLFQETKPGSAGQRRIQGSPRILVIGIIGVAGILLLALLAVPALIGTNMFFAAGAGCSGQQSGTAG